MFTIVEHGALRDAVVPPVYWRKAMSSCASGGSSRGLPPPASALGKEHGGGRFHSGTIFPKSLITNFVVKHVKKMVPEWNLPGRRVVSRPRSPAGAASRSTSRRSATRTSRSSSTPAARPASPRARCSRTATSSPTCCKARPGGAAGLREGEEIIITALPLYHIFALTGNCLTFMKIGAHNILIVNPRDIPKFVEELAQVAVSPASPA